VLLGHGRHLPTDTIERDRAPNGRPSIAEATDRLNHLRQHGPSPTAFTFGKAFAAPDALEPRAPFTLAADCHTT
jgi:hypothetical protein